MIWAVSAQRIMKLYLNIWTLEFMLPLHHERIIRLWDDPDGTLAPLVPVHAEDEKAAKATYPNAGGT